jgi:serine/threonine protein phosphatase PrpC
VTTLIPNCSKPWATPVPPNDRFNRNVLFTCLGSPGKPVVDTAGPLLLQEGDRIMLCSDGLWGTVEDDVITRQPGHPAHLRSRP